VTHYFVWKNVVSVVVGLFASV